MSPVADAAAVLQPGFTGPSVPAWLVEARAAGLVSLVLWFSVIAVGRIFAYNL